MKFYWGKKPAPVTSGDSVYVRTPLDAPLSSISLEEPEKPWIKVSGVSLADAAKLFPGKSIRWHSVSHVFRAKLEAGNQSEDMTLAEFRGMIF